MTSSPFSKNYQTVLGLFVISACLRIACIAGALALSAPLPLMAESQVMQLTPYERDEEAVKLLKDSIQAFGDAVQSHYRESRLSDIEAAIKPGDQAKVYLHYQTIDLINEQREVLIDVSPHPSPEYWKEANIKFRTEVMIVTGRYVSEGMSKYGGFEQPSTVPRQAQLDS